MEFRYLCGTVDHSGALEEAGVCEADAIIIGPAEDLPDNEVCAQAGFNQPEQQYKDAILQTLHRHVYKQEVQVKCPP